ncbi:3-dehydroquinate dehydratase [Halosimplex carlsbadense 2-9-1]|uniref:3-dehydroquinate dehydratase n=1 Tax=Halosimplex carlsbadense 2-9-1 TaxID=797114 RepID=M0CE82_9EURY|nr:type I 3-dehydroquinate dehydratase [Halosimplex carlsbadense]ELZ20194.1 3-dehydroquinate dehydratase [Halosimplex carlsbadense 2-9-1]
METDFSSFVLAAATADLSDEPAARDDADAVEFRLDLATEPLDALATYDGELPLIATNRATWEGGEAADDAARLDALEVAAEHDAVGAIDVELAALERGDAAGVVDHAREHGTAVIVSTHDFEGTPHRDAMAETLSEASRLGDVAKLAVTAEGAGDVLDLLGATWAATTAGETVATMAMGEAGRHSRAVAPLYGSRIGYAPVDPADATAPGQYDLATLAGLVERLGDV